MVERRYAVYYGDKMIGWERANSRDECLRKCHATNPHYLPERFRVSAAPIGRSI